MEFEFKDEILQLKPFESIFEQMERTDSTFAASFKTSLLYDFEEVHKELSNANTKVKVELALMKLKIICSEEKFQLTKLLEDKSSKDIILMKYVPIAYNNFMENLQTDLQIILTIQKQKMIKELEQLGRWHTDLSDSAKKNGNAVIKTSKKLYNKITSSDKSFDSEEEIETKHLMTLVEKVINKHLNETIIAEKLAVILEIQSKLFVENWSEKIETTLPKNHFQLSLPDRGIGKVNIDYNPGLSVNILSMGIGSGFAGATGLAMGWHTLSYSMLNVLPPVAIFTAMATFAAGILNKEKMLKQKQEEISETVVQFYNSIVKRLYTEKQDELDNLSISEFIEKKSIEIVENAIQVWQKRTFGDISIDQIKAFIDVFSFYEMYLDEAIASLK